MHSECDRLRFLTFEYQGLLVYANKYNFLTGGSLQKTTICRYM